MIKTNCLVLSEKMFRRLFSTRQASNEPVENGNKNRIELNQPKNNDKCLDDASSECGRREKKKK